MKMFENKTYPLLPAAEFKLLSGMQFPNADSDLGKAIIANADAALQIEIPQLYASLYLRFSKDGNRSEYEKNYFERRTLLKQLLLGEIVQNENRYTEKIIDLVWLISEETSWIIPAHNYNTFSLAVEDSHKIPLPFCYDGTHTFVDLFSAETAAILSLVYYYLKDKIEAISPCSVNNRILYAVRERVLMPFLRTEHMWWMGYAGKKPNNWNPWIVSNILICTACAESEQLLREQLTAKVLRVLDNFIDIYAEDGGCNEGPHYWGEAAAALFDAFEILDDMTGGKTDAFSNPLVYNMMDYIRKVHLTDSFFANFADADPALYKEGIPNVFRMGQRTGNVALTAFAATFTLKLIPLYCNYGHNYRALKNVCTLLPQKQPYIAAEFDVLPNLQLAVWRKGEFCAAIKGGHNAESHNHNDVGNCIILHNGKPIFIDIGAPTYTKDLFSSKRYEVFPTASEYHNLPIVNGHTQKVGADYRANRFVADENGASVEYTSAYSNETVHSCVREINVTENSVSLHESIKANGEIRLQYYMAKQPQMLENNTLALEGVNITLPSDVNCSIEAVPLTDAKIIKNWHTDTLYKLVVVGKNAVDITLQIEPEI